MLCLDSIYFLNNSANYQAKETGSQSLSITGKTFTVLQIRLSDDFREEFYVGLMAAGQRQR